MKFADKLKFLRKEKHLTQKELADVLKVKQNTIARYENGTRKPDIETLCKLADFFGTTTDEIMGRED